MTFVFQKLSDHGTRNKVVARLILQTSELLKFTKYDEPKRHDVFNAIYTAASRLLRCWEVADRLATQSATQKQRFEARPERSREIPSLPALEREVENFLVEAKDYFRDLAEALNVAFGTAFSDGAGDLWNKRKDQSKARAWARATFGEEHRLTALLTRSEPWIAETIKRRNASEHPGGWCGRLTVLNFRVSPEGQILDPAWFRRDTPPTDLVRDLVGLVDDMLVFGEELVASIAETHAWGPMLEIEEVPEGVRDPQAPVRLRINLKTEFALPPEDKDASGQR